MSALNMQIRSTLLLLSAAALALTASGCQTPRGDRVSRRVPGPVGTVTTGGTYATPKVFAVDPTGVPLAYVVESALRPAIQKGRFVTPVAAIQPQPAVTPATQGKTKLPPSDSFVKMLKLTGPDFEWERDIVDELAGEISSGERFELTSKYIFEQRQILKQGLVAGTLTNQQLALARLAEILGVSEEKLKSFPKVHPTAEAFDVLFEQLKEKNEQGGKLDRDEIQEVFKSVTNDGLVTGAIEILLFGPTGDNPQPLITADNESQLRQRIHALLSFETMTAASGEASKTEVVSQVNTSQSVDLIEQMIVVVRRGSGSAQFIPLSIVESTAAGDILLVDGDRVEITSFARTALGLRPNFTPADRQRRGRIALTGFLSGAKEGEVYQDLSAIESEVASSHINPISDLIVVSVNNQGRQEDYWLPRNSDQFARLAAPSLSEIELLPGDVVNVNAIDLMPVVRKSQLAARTTGLRAAEVKIKKRLRQVSGSAGVTGLGEEVSKIGAVDTMVKSFRAFSPF